MNYIQELERNINSYIDVVEKLSVNGNKYTIITPYSACVIGYNSESRKYTIKQYTVNYKRELIHGVIREHSKITKDLLLSYFVDLRNEWESFPYCSNFMDVLYETHEIFSAIRLINIQLYRTKLGLIKDPTIQNVFPACKFSKITFNDIDEKHTAIVNIKIYTLDEIKENMFECEVKLDYTQDNVELLYNAFMKMYYEYRPEPCHV